MKTNQLRKVSELSNIEKQKQDYRKFIRVAMRLEEIADHVFGLVEDKEIVKLWAADPIEVMSQPDQEIREAAAMLYTAAQAVDRYPYKWNFEFIEYECHVKVGDFTLFPF